jgi:anti-sigma factor ChrR (cupin superfamily)
LDDVKYEIIEHQGQRYAEIIWAGSKIGKSRFYSPADSSMQMGLLAHEAGFTEPGHFHKAVERKITDLQQMLVVQKGKIALDFFDRDGRRFREVIVGPGDAVLLVHGAHSVRVLEDMQCVSVKQGPFLGAENDKIEIEVRS